MMGTFASFCGSKDIESGGKFVAGMTSNAALRTTGAVSMETSFERRNGVRILGYYIRLSQPQ